VDDAEFERMKAADEFLETAGVYGRKYGTPRKWVETQLERGRLVILEIDVEGAITVKKNIRDAYSIFILPPSDEELLRRLRERKREDENGIQKRFGKAREEIARAHSCGVYDVFITNRDIDAAIAPAIQMVRLERARRRASKEVAFGRPPSQRGTAS
jgi:guanylate kinase